MSRMSRRRKVPKKGMSYLDANKGRLITMEDDVLGVKRLIEDTWDELYVVFDEVDEEWVVVERCRDGMERLVLSTPALSMEIFERLQRADQMSRGDADILKEVDSWNERLERDLDRRLDDQIREATERFEFALRKDGVLTTDKVFLGGRRRVMGA